MTQDVPLTIAFLAGVFSFLSPCVLPIVPGFMSYILGKSFSDIQNTSKLNKLRLLPLILLFISGFSLVFIIMGASIDLISDVFFDYKKQNWEKDFNFVRDLGVSLQMIFNSIIDKKYKKKWTVKDKELQYNKRGRYAEFNLLYDRGTKFGLQTGGNVEGILMSLPPLAKWN